MAPDALSRLEGEILAHASWVRRLARSLVASEADAEDVVQETWVAALRRPAGEGAPARPWLARVVRNLAARRWRRTDVSLESSASLTAAGGGDMLDSVERLETQRILVEELQALPEPARRVILLRYFDGLDAAEIARRTGEPHGTVRWRLHEALAVLRTRLDRRHGGERESWMRALTFGAPPLAAPLVPQTASTPLVPASLALSTGVLAVNTFIKIAVAAVVVLALSVGVYVTIQDAPRGTASETPATTQVAEPLPDAPKDSHLFDVANPAQRAAIDAPSAPAPAAPAPAAGLQGVLVARCIDEQLRPLAGAWLSTDIRLAAAENAVGGSIARSGRDGELRMDVPMPGHAVSVNFIAGCDGYATRWLRVKLVPDGIAYAGELVFVPAGSVTGRVLGADDRAIGGAEIVVTPLGDGRVSGDLDLMRVRGPEFEIGVPRATSGDDGRFLVGCLPPGPARVWARARGTRWSVSAPVDIVERAETRDVELILERDDPESKAFGPIEGIVLAPDESPVKSPEISVRYSESGSTTVSGVYGEADGRFEIVPFGHGPHDLTFSGGDLTPVLLENVAPGTRGLVVRLGKSQPVAIVVRSGGELVANFEIHRSGEGALASQREASATDHPDGRTILMAPAAVFTFVVDAQGYLPKTMGPYDGRQALGEIEVSLDPVPGVHGRVLAQGAPVAGARVWLQGYARQMKVQLNEFELWVTPEEQCVATTDAEGRFRLGLKEDGEFMLFAEATGWAKAEIGPLELNAGVGQKDIEVALEAGGAIEGHVRMPSGRDPAGTIVGINHGEGRPRTQTVGPDGRFRFEKLTPGGWKVMRCREDFGGSSSTAVSSGPGIVGGTIDTNCVVVLGQTTRFDLDLRDDRPCVLDLELKLDGKPAKAWSASLRPMNLYAITRDLPQGATDSQGRARIAGEDPGAYEVILVAAAEDATGLEIRLAVDLARGTTPLKRDLRTGSLEGVIASWDEDSEHGWIYESVHGADFPAQIAIHADADGRFSLPIVPAGPGRILHDVSTVPHESENVPVASFTAEAGKTTTVSVP